MELFRLARKKYAKTLSGKGAAIKGARWNSTGIEMIYTAENKSLAMAEVSVHFTLATLPSDYMMITIFAPNDISIINQDEKKLVKNWNTFPHKRSTKIIGDSFVSDLKACILKVSSAVTQGDFSYLINPNHSDFSQIKIIKTIPFKFDNRIF